MLAFTFLHFVAYVARLRGKASFSLSPCTHLESLLKQLLKTSFGSPRPLHRLLEIKWLRVVRMLETSDVYIRCISNAPYAHVSVI